MESTGGKKVSETLRRLARDIHGKEPSRWEKSLKRVKGDSILNAGNSPSKSLDTPRVTAGGNTA